MKLKSSLLKEELTATQERKLFRAFASWSKARKYEYIKKLPKERAARLKYTWEAWARDDQLAPVGEWSVWVCQAGRGWGKTRTGAEWVIEQARRHPGCHIALVGRTVADVRKVMVQGRSGILACSSPRFMPEYNPSNRELVWPNGSHATTYSADVPDQLRGPQHSFAWCLAGDTLVLMGDGTEKQLKDIRVGDYVMTRKGPRRVTWQGLTKRKSEVYLLQSLGRQAIIGTAEHPVWIQGRGFVPISELSKGMPLLCATNASNLAVTCGINVDIEIITNDVSCSIDLFGNKLMAPFLKDATFTTKMGIKQTTDWKTLNCLRTENIAEDTLKKNWVHTEKYLLQIQSLPESEMQKNVWNEVFIVHGVEQNIIAQQHIQHVFAQASVLKPQDQGLLLAKCENVNFAEQNTQPGKEVNGIVQKNAMTELRNSVHPLKCVPLSVQTATNLLSQNGQMPGFAQESVLLFSTDEIAFVEKLPTLIDVYDITVEDAHEFFANDILVHNCDEVASWQYADAWDQLVFGLRIEPVLGVQPQCIVTTTPRNTKAVKALVADPDTIVTRGKTYDNRENLSPKFIKEIDKRYKGTRLGRQEIEGEIIDDIDGALWKRQWIEDFRVGKHPELKRIVVAVDPPATSQETSDEPAECGIVVCGLGVDDHGYVLADFSTVGTPDEWAGEVLRAYALFEADCVVGEVNNGGDMVGHTIKTAAKDKGMKHVPFKSVRATRGKQLRAEPISLPYQRGLIHHCGCFPDLEDQQCLRADTLIATEHGQRRIDEVKVGDYVWTSKGLRRVINAGCTNLSAEVYEMKTSDNRYLVATMCHPVYNIDERKFVPFGLLKQNDTLEVFRCQEDGDGAQKGLMAQLDAWGSMAHRLNGMGDYGVSIIQDIIDMQKVNCCIGLFGKQRMGLFQQTKKSITGMGISKIMRLRILNWCHMLRTCNMSLFTELLFGMSRLAGQSVNSFGQSANRMMWSAKSVEQPIKQQQCVRNIAPSVVGVKCIGVKKLPKREPVYNIEVEDAHEYYANGIRVHNCNWVVGEKSPDRLDACVWGFTELMIEEKEDSGILIATPEDTAVFSQESDLLSAWSSAQDMEW